MSCPGRHFPRRRAEGGGQVWSQVLWPESRPKPQGKASMGPGEQSVGRRVFIQIAQPGLHSVAQGQMCTQKDWGSMKA